jgi:hypothetical protein
MFAGTTTVKRLTGTSSPSFNTSTNVLTLPNVTGVQWRVNGVNKTAGAQPALTVGQTAYVTALPLAGHKIEGDDDWTYDYVAP